MKNTSIALLAGAAALAVACESERKVDAVDEPAPAARAMSTAGQVAAPETSASVLPSSVGIPGVASCQPSSQMDSMVTRWVQLADADGNRQISKKEAQSFTNFVIGGAFFRADDNGDGVVSPEEGRTLRSEFLEQYSALAMLLNQARSAVGESPFKAIADMVNLEYGKPLRAEDARAAARGVLDDLFEVADGDENGTITLAEARDASWRAAQALGQQLFKSVDANGDARLELAEFQKAVGSTTALAFKAGDINDNGSLTEQEAAIALSGVISRLGIPAASGSK